MCLTQNKARELAAFAVYMISFRDKDGEELQDHIEVMARELNDESVEPEDVSLLLHTLEGLLFGSAGLSREASEQVDSLVAKYWEAASHE